MTYKYSPLGFMKNIFLYILLSPVSTLVSGCGGSCCMHIDTYVDVFIFDKNNKNLLESGDLKLSDVSFRTLDLQTGQLMPLDRPIVLSEEVGEHRIRFFPEQSNLWTYTVVSFTSKNTRRDTIATRHYISETSIILEEVKLNNKPARRIIELIKY